MKNDFLVEMKAMLTRLSEIEEPARIAIINELRSEIRKYSPFAGEPVDCVQWVPLDQVQANDYNPNTVAPPEMTLLEHSIREDGFTQPIVVWANNEHYEVVDGFHRHRVGREIKDVNERLRGYLPLAIINTEREDRGDRIAATIRHNRARGKHDVEGMSEIVVELKRRNWSDDRIGKELGMEPDEVLRLCQISGLADMFANEDFTQAWEHVPSEYDEEELSMGESVDLEWASHFKEAVPEGWKDRTGKSSVLYGAFSQKMGLVFKSKFDDSWFWKAYTIPMQEGKSESLEQAKIVINKIFSKDNEEDLAQL